MLILFIILYLFDFIDISSDGFCRHPRVNGDPEHRLTPGLPPARE